MSGQRIIDGLTDAVLRAEVERLRAAIEKHRLDVWGDGPVGHPDDETLYAALSSPAAGRSR